MSERTADSIAQEPSSDAPPVGNDEIIDVSAVDLDDTDSWLYSPVRCQMESRIHDLYAWLREEPQLDLPSGESNRKSVDTRTFTRPKKRSCRMSFESVFEALSSVTPNVSRNQQMEPMNVDRDASLNQDVETERKESIPPMLKPMTATSLICNESLTSGQESMEAFLKMSESKGIDSFINLTEPEFTDPIMNVSQPSVLSSSIIASTRDDSLCNIDYDNVTNSNMSKLSLTTDLTETVNLINFDETFLKESANNTVIKNRSYCSDVTDRTFVNRSNITKTKDFNETYDAECVNNKSVASCSKHETSALSSTFTSSNNIASDPVQEEEKESLNVLNTTYLPLETQIEHDVTSAHANENCDISSKETAVAHTITRPMHENSFNSTFKIPISFCNQSTPKQLNVLDTTFKAFTKQPRPISASNLYSTFKAPSSLRRELIAEIQRSEENRLDSTYSSIPKEQSVQKDAQENIDATCDQNIKSYNDIPRDNKYNTYRKSSLNETKEHTEQMNSNTAICPSKESQDRRFYTFTKKSSSNSEKTDIGNAEPVGDRDATFCKPLPKLQKRTIQPPRTFSKLPQFLQKSNPNLVSNSLKTTSTGACTNPPTVGYMKGSHPNIVQDVRRSVTNKHLLGNVKSGSEQRLVEVNVNAAGFQMTGAGGSTESIESTQSAHSAPDLDDRLSTCSDNSHTSYSKHTMNIQQLHQIVRMQEESLRQESTPKSNRRILENTWIEAKQDLPSPILKNGLEESKSDSSSPFSIDTTVKTSSPLLSPTGSSQSVNTNGNPDENVTKKQNDPTTAKTTETINKPEIKPENKTRLRQPTNTGSRPSSISGIPRLPSRIPALRFARPNVKSTQGDLKKGYM